jgi:hypothetical protein
LIAAPPPRIFWQHFGAETFSCAKLFACCSSQTQSIRASHSTRVKKTFRHFRGENVQIWDIQKC